MVIGKVDGYNSNQVWRLVNNEITVSKRSPLGSGQENEMYSRTAGGQIYHSPLANTGKKGEKSF